LIKPDMSSAFARSRSPATIRSDRRLGAGIAVSVLLHALLLSLQFGVPGLDLGSGGPIAVTLAPYAPPDDAPPVSAPVPLAAEPVPPVPAAAPPVPVAVPTPAPVPVPAPARVNGLRLVDLPPPPAVKIAKPASAQARPKHGKPSIKRRVRELPAPVIVAAPHPDSEFTVPLPEVVPQTIPEPAPLLAQETEDQATTPPPAQSASEEAATGTDDEAEELARLVVEEQRQRAQEEAQERERIARQAADEAQAAQLEAQELLARQQLEQQQRQEQEQEQEQALLARQEQERVARDAAPAARANDELMRRREAQELASRQLADQRAAEQAALQAQAQAAAQEQARADALRLAREQAERQRLDAQRLAREQAERERIEAQNRLAQERARQQADERARADAERLARQQAEEAARRSAAERLQAQGSGAAPGSGQPDSPGLGAGGPGVGNGASNGAGSGAGDRSQPGALAGMPGSRARELLRGLTIPGAGVALPAARRDDPRRALADGGERDAPLRLYVDSVRQKLERNAVLGGARLALRDVRIDPLVSLALRSDGSIDEVTIVRSSGRADIDEAVRRFVRLNARYSAFPPNVAARFDVIEIRRIWRFTDGLKLLEEMR
jgi:actin-related protein